MNFGTPTYLYALAAISIPIVIHLWSKNTKTRVPFGSLKFLKETETKTTKHLFPSELLLLAIRILLIASLAVLFAAPFIKQPAEIKTAYLVDPNITTETFEKLKEQLDLDETYWLSPVKTPITSAISFGNLDFWSTLKVFSDYDSIVVYSNLLLDQFQSELTSLSSKVNWIQIPNKPRIRRYIVWLKVMSLPRSRLKRIQNRFYLIYKWNQRHRLYHQHLFSF